MSDINEEQKRLYKRAEENDYIVKDIAQYEENDSELAKYTILELQDRINKAIEYMNDPDNFLCINVEEQGRVLMDEDSQNDLINILKGKE
jgi:hypothetical protein